MKIITRQLKVCGRKNWGEGRILFILVAYISSGLLFILTVRMSNMVRGGSTRHSLSLTVTALCQCDLSQVQQMSIVPINYRFIANLDLLLFLPQRTI